MYLNSKSISCIDMPRYPWRISSWAHRGYLKPQIRKNLYCIGFSPALPPPPEQEDFLVNQNKKKGKGPTNQWIIETTYTGSADTLAHLYTLIIPIKVKCRRENRCFHEWWLSTKKTKSLSYLCILRAKKAIGDLVTNWKSPELVYNQER